MTYKYLKFGSKTSQKTQIIVKVFKKIPLWADFSKNSPSSDFENTRFRNIIE
jgi:hypothetical protein